jgi:hypothetical protein
MAGRHSDTDLSLLARFRPIGFALAPPVGLGSVRFGKKVSVVLGSVRFAKTISAGLGWVWFVLQKSLVLPIGFGSVRSHKLRALHPRQR